MGPGGLLNQLTKNVLETALEAEMSERLGCPARLLLIGDHAATSGLARADSGVDASQAITPAVCAPTSRGCATHLNIPTHV